jgi:hypothetical protein
MEVNCGEHLSAQTRRVTVGVALTSSAHPGNRRNGVTRWRLLTNRIMICKMDQLVLILNQLIDLLKGVGESHWSAWLRTDAELIRSNNLSGVQHLLSAYGGMGSLKRFAHLP